MGSVQSFFEIFLPQKISNFLLNFIKQTPFKNPYPFQSYCVLKNPENPPKGVRTPFEKFEGSKIFIFDTKNVLYSVFIHAEYESVVEKILKIFSTKLESENHISPRHKSRIPNKNFEIRNF